MSARVCRAAAVSLTGLDGTVVFVEAAVSQQLPGMAIIGLPDAALAEAKLRVRTATSQIGLSVAERFVTSKRRNETVGSAAAYPQIVVCRPARTVSHA
ncbi:hypothetical protein ACXR2T_10525 [Leucobacter sp. HY1910]